MDHPHPAQITGFRHVVTGDIVAGVLALKDEPGDELQIWGSGKLLETLLLHELVDRFRLMTFPLVLGTGRRLFNNGILPATMRAVDLIMTDLGIVIGTWLCRQISPVAPVQGMSAYAACIWLGESNGLDSAAKQPNRQSPRIARTL